MRCGRSSNTADFRTGTAHFRPRHVWPLCTTPSSRVSVLGELLRVTAPDGRVAVGDVAADSPASEFLNRFVDRHTEAGHAGRFYTPAALAAHLEAAGGRELLAEEAAIAWRFAESDDARVFFRELFGLRPETSDGQIEAALETLGLAGSAGSWAVPWTMVYASAGRR